MPKPARKGSQKWLQHFVGHRPDLLQTAVLGPVTWKSPVELDKFAEYRDGRFLQMVGLERLASDLAAFWPARGPQWDGLAVDGDRIVLVEAKSHLRELFSPPSAAGPTSRAMIDKALDSARQSIGCAPGTAWSDSYYQLANRLAHLDFLRTRGVDAHLLLVGFINDAEMRGPASMAEWHAAYEIAFRVLGIDAANPFLRFVHHVHPDVAPFSTVAPS